MTGSATGAAFSTGCGGVACTGAEGCVGADDGLALCAATGPAKTIAVPASAIKAVRVMHSSLQYVTRWERTKTLILLQGDDPRQERVGIPFESRGQIPTFLDKRLTRGLAALRAIAAAAIRSRGSLYHPELE